MPNRTCQPPPDTTNWRCRHANGTGRASVTTCPTAELRGGEREFRRMSSLSFPGLAFYVLVLIGAFAVRSAAEFGAGLIAVPMLAFILPVSTAVSVATASHHAHLDAASLSRLASNRVAAVCPGCVSYTVIGIGVGFYFIKLLGRKCVATWFGFVSDYLFYLRVVDDEYFACGANALARRFGRSRRHHRRPLQRIVRGWSWAVIRSVFRSPADGEGCLPSDDECRRANRRCDRMAGYGSYGFYGHSTVALLMLGLPLVLVGSWLGDRSCIGSGRIRFLSLSVLLFCLVVSPYS